MARMSGARGIAFDFYFSDNAETRPIDDLLCKEVREARDQQFPVFVGYGVKEVNGIPTREDIAENLRPCLPLTDAQGHLVGFKEPDSKVRMIPLFFVGAIDREALCLKIATALGGATALPESKLLQFVAPERDYPIADYDQLFADEDSRIAMRDRFVLVGGPRDTDVAKSPFGIREGVILHSYAIHSLRTGQFIQRAPLWVSFPMVYLSTFLLTLLFDWGYSVKKIAVLCVAGSVLIVLSAAMAIMMWLYWVDIVYPLLSIWLLFPLLYFLRKLQPRQAAALQQSTPVASEADGPTAP
jgi:hypothetical protein